MIKTETLFCQKVERKKIPKSVFKEERGKGDGEELEMQENSKDSIRLWTPYVTIYVYHKLDVNWLIF